MCLSLQIRIRGTDTDTDAGINADTDIKMVLPLMLIPYADTDEQLTEHKFWDQCWSEGLAGRKLHTMGGVHLVCK